MLQTMMTLGRLGPGFPSGFTVSHAEKDTAGHPRAFAWLWRNSRKSPSRSGLILFDIIWYLAAPNFDLQVPGVLSTRTYRHAIVFKLVNSGRSQISREIPWACFIHWLSARYLWDRHFAVEGEEVAVMFTWGPGCCQSTTRCNMPPNTNSPAATFAIAGRHP